MSAGHGELAAFLRSSVFPEATDVGVVALERTDGGASWETFFATLAVRRGPSERRERVVLKRAPADGPMAPYEIAKDVAILTALSTSEIPVPRLLAWTEDPGVFERPFTVTAFVEGESPDLTKVERWPTWQQHREELGLAIVDLAAALARFRWQGTGIASVMGPPGGSGARVSSMVDRYLDPLLARSSEHGVPQPFCRDVGMWLTENVFELDEQDLCVVHGDFRFGNFLFEGCRIVAVVDWERAMLGDPMSNLGFLCMPMSRRTQPELMGKALPFAQLEHRYQALHGLEFSRKRLQYYMVFWQFLECVNSSRNVLDAVVGDRRAVGSRGLLAPNLLVRQTLRLVEDYEAGRYDIA